MKKFVKPVLLKEEKYQAANDAHCHQVKDECSPNQAKA